MVLRERKVSQKNVRITCSEDMFMRDNKLGATQIFRDGIKFHKEKKLKAKKLIKLRRKK